ncbi:glycosyltransferase [Candidatus Woesearchaeota archaeon]|nr:glycosyltransferase [Candidatus Woesearchaeota archaeon]
MKNLTVLIPCYNEEKGIGKVIDGIPKEKLNALGYNTNVIIIDNNCTDKTVEIAKSKGALIIKEPIKGKGKALIKGFSSLNGDTDVVVMLDGDNTYQSSEMIRLIEPIDNNFCDAVIGTRLSGKINSGSMSTFNRIGNWAFTFLVRVAYHGNITDVCTGYFAWKREVIDSLSKTLTSNGFAIEMEMITKMIKMGYSIYSVPITYNRSEKSSSLHPVKDGAKILTTWARNLAWQPNGYKK